MKTTIQPKTSYPFYVGARISEQQKTILDKAVKASGVSQADFVRHAITMLATQTEEK